MPESKQIRIKFAVDEQSAMAFSRTVQRMIAEANKLTKALGGNLGGGGGILTGSVGPARSNVQMLGASQRSTGGSGKSPLTALLTENAAAMKGLAATSATSMRFVTTEVSRAVEQQRRHIRGLDADLARLARRYGEVASEGAQTGIAGRMGSKFGARSAAVGELERLESLQRQVSPPYLPSGPLAGPPGGFGGGGGGWSYGNSAFGRAFPMRNGSGQLFRPGFAAGAVGAGILAGANELIAQPFDLVSNQSKQMQAMGGMGVATKQGDLRYAIALAQVLGDPDKRKELGLVGERDFSYGISGAGGSVRGLLQGDPNVPGNLLRGVMNVNSRQKEALRSYVEQQVQSDPNFYANLGRFQSEAGGRLGLMRRTGIGERNLSALAQGVGYGSAQDMGEISGAFEAARPGGRGFAQRNLGVGLRASRGGMDLGAVSALAGAGSRDVGGVLAGLSGVDVVASEHLAHAIAGALRSSGYGPTSGSSMLGAMTGVGFGDRPELDVYRAGQRAAALPGVGAVLGGSADPFGRGLNVLAANRIVGPGGDFYKARALAQLGGDPAAMFAAMNGESTGLLDAQGITKGDATRMFGETVTRNVRSRFISGAGGTSGSPATAAMQRLVDAYGGDPRAMFAAEGRGSGGRERLLDELGVGMSEILPQTFSSAAQGREAMATLIGAGGRGKRGRGLGDAGYKSLSRAYTAGKLGAGEEEMGEFLRTTEAPMIEAFSKVLKPLGDSMLKMGDMNQSAAAAAASLLALVQATRALSAVFDKMSGRERAKALNSERMRLLGAAESAKAAPMAAAARQDAAEDAASSRVHQHGGSF